MKLYRRCFSTRGIAPAMVAIGTARFRLPNESLLLLSWLVWQFLDIQCPAKLLQPWDFVCMLLSMAPIFSEMSYGPDRHFNGPQLLNELLNGDTCPQSKGQFHLIRAFIPQEPFPGLPSKCGMLGGLVSVFLLPIFRLEDRFVPFANGGLMNAGNFSDFSVLPAGFSKTDRLVSKLLLGLCAKFSCICFFHANNDSTFCI